MAPVVPWRVRARASLDTLGSAPWRRAPVLLWRRPSALLATAGAVMVLAASLASVPLFLSSAGTEAVALQAGERCPRDTGATLRSESGASPSMDEDDPFAPLAGQLGPSIRWGRLETVLEGAEPTQRTPVVVLYRDGSTDQVDVVDGPMRPDGAWLSDRAVAMSRVDGAAEVGLAGISVPVAGTYRDLAAGTISDPYWCAHRPDLLLRGADLVPPRPVVLVDRATWTRLAGADGATAVEAAWEAPLRGGVTVSEADGLIDQLACDGSLAPDLAWCDAGRPAVVGATGATDATDADEFVEGFFGSSLPFVVERSRSIQVAVGGGVWPVASLAALAAAGLVGATAVLWCDRRRRELALLAARGVSPAAMGCKAVLELLGALLVGAAAGVAFAHGLVVGVGPASTLEPSAIVRAWWTGAAVALVAGVVVAGVVVARTSGSMAGRRRGVVHLVPWELALAALTALSWHRLGAWGAPVSSGATVSRVDIGGLMFPVLFLLTAVVVTARLLLLALAPVRAMSREWPNPLYLAVRRVARYRVAVVGVVATSALATGVFAYAATVQRSMDATLSAKALVYLGSDVVVRVPQGERLPAALAGRSTSVDLFQQAWVELPRGDGTYREQVNVFAIDPATFASASFWDDTLASLPLDEIVERLADAPASGRVPVVVVGIDLPTVADAGIVTAGTTRFEVAEAAEVQAFPGMRKGSTAMFIAASALADLGLDTRVREVRVRGERSEILRALDEAGTSYQEVTTSDSVVDAVSFLTVSQTFGFMRSLALAAAVLVVGGVALYLDSRRRSRVLSYAFARRMGLTRSEHRRALAAELSAGVGTGCWLGLVVALAAAALAIGRLDPLPLIRPDPLLRPAVVLSVGVAVGVALLAVLAAALAQRRTDHDDPVEVLRGGT